MATVLENLPDVVTESPIEPRRFTVKEYYLMAEAGVLNPDERLELIEGEILIMSPKGNRHTVSTTLAAKYFIGRLGDVATVHIQDPILLSEHSEPEPDIALSLPDELRYLDHHPRPEEVLFVLEIADTTLARDRRKTLLYARAGIIQTCILNLNKDELEDYREPDEGGYRNKQTYRADQSFALVAFPEVVINVRDLLPPR